MTWKPTDEMWKLFCRAAFEDDDGGNPDMQDALIAVQPLIAAEVLEAAAAHFERGGNKLVPQIIRSLIPKPPEGKR